MSPLDKQKNIKKASESVAQSPIAGRTRTSTAAPSLQEIMDGLQSMLTPQFANLKSDVVSSVSASLNERFMDLENNLDQLKSTMDTQQQDIQAELSQVLQRLEAVEQENARLRGVPSSSTNQKMSNPPPNSNVLGTAASKYATPSAQTSPPPESSQRSIKPAPSGKSYYGGLRFFTPVSSNQGFQHLYLPSRGRRPYNEVRELLYEKVQMERGAVIDIHYPSSTVIALLVHNDYVETATQLLRTKKLAPIEGFNPYDHNNLGNKEYAKLSVPERETKMKEIVEHQPYVTIESIKRPAVKLSVARDFHRKGKITSEFLQELVQLHSNSPSNINDTQGHRQRETDQLMIDDDEDDTMDHHS
ncbi:hypothetical protein PS6_009296, partial [Mucor atramentarius]